MRSLEDASRSYTASTKTGKCCDRGTVNKVPCPHVGAACAEDDVDIAIFVDPFETTKHWKAQYAGAPKFEIPPGGSETHGNFDVILDHFPRTS